jgi:hypothetical protein
MELGSSNEWLGIERSSIFGWATAKGTENTFFQWTTAADKGHPESPESNEPNNWGGEEDCVEYRGEYTKWNDILCQEKRRFACRFDTCPKVIYQLPD